MIEWILEHLGIVVVIVLFVAQMVRGVLQQAKNRQPPPMQRAAGEEERRVREVQEQIRRQIAARRSGQVPAPERAPVSTAEEPRPLPRPETTQLPEFGGPLGRMLEELQRKVQQQHTPPPPPPPPLVVERRNVAELERQEHLAAELKALEDARQVAKRRAMHVADDKLAVAESEPALRSGARERLLGDLSDPQSLRRAFVLREVLGPPIGLR
jgi:hypothetical protein